MGQKPHLGQQRATVVSNQFLGLELSVGVALNIHQYPMICVRLNLHHLPKIKGTSICSQPLMILKAITDILAPRCL